MRGSRWNRHKDDPDYGIIPAHAGLTAADSRPETRPWDHPRACGAHSSLQLLQPPSSGSSPRMRGSPRCLSGSLGITGIIPAHAGLTGVRTFGSGSAGDHPRACGAHHTETAAGWGFLGSSPRMRGSQFRCSHKSGQRGIIPAHAGLTSLF